DVRNYLQHPERREAIAAELDRDKLADFLNLLGSWAAARSAMSPEELENLCVDMAALMDRLSFRDEGYLISGNSMPFGLRHSAAAAIEDAMESRSGEVKKMVANAILKSGKAISLSSHLLFFSYLKDDGGGGSYFSESDKENLLCWQRQAILYLVGQGQFAKLAYPGFVLSVFARLCPDACPEVLDEWRKSEPSLDTFARLVVGGSSSNSMEVFQLASKDRPPFAEAFCPLSDLEAHAQARLADVTLSYPAKAAWRAVVEKVAITEQGDVVDWPPG
ncbi:MAG TPA: hypothetical protein VLC30_05095, partial [Pseudomonas sp.]|nr:hypothetical protein [Pseudomonas sp.]